MQLVEIFTTSRSCILVPIALFSSLSRRSLGTRILRFSCQGSGGQDLSSKKNVITRIKQLMGYFDLVDIWKHLNPIENQFTWSSSDLKVKCRLDYGLVSRDSLQSVDSSEIEVFPHCDHLQVTLLINGAKQHPRGPGYWKFNASLPEDKNFVEEVTTKIPGFINQYQGVVDKGLSCVGIS